MSKTPNISERPKFDYPPVSETVHGVQFSELSGFRMVHFGRYWDCIRDRFPTTQDHERRSQVIETIPRMHHPMNLELQLHSQTVPQRVWYFGKDEDEVIQIQPDWFIFNWRQQGKDYPSFSKTSVRFRDEFKRFKAFCLEDKIEEPIPNLVEVSYINKILPADNEPIIEYMGRLFTGLCWKESTSDIFLGLPEAGTFNRVWVMNEKEGRLYAEASIAYDPENKQEFILLRMTGRIPMKPEGIPSVSECLEQAHGWVVRGFCAITNPDIQVNQWRRIK